jgi:hypothetical protein
LTGLRVDIKSETQIREEERREASAAAEKESAEGEAGEDSTAETAGEVAGTSEVVEAEKGEATAGD